MHDTLDVIILDDEKLVCEVISDLVSEFYTWGQVHAFTDFHAAVKFCLERDIGVAVFIVDVYLSGESAFSFLDSILDKFPMAFEDTIIITGHASADIVNICLDANINYLLEKPVRPYALQLAVRAIVSKYLHFIKKLHMNPTLMGNLPKLKA